MDVYLDGFTDFTPQETLVIKALLKQANSVTVALTCDSLDDERDSAGIFAPARHTARSLLRLARENGIPARTEVQEERAKEGPEELAFLEAHLFDAPETPWADKPAHISLHAPVSIILPICSPPQLLQRTFHMHIFLHLVPWHQISGSVGAENGVGCIFQICLRIITGCLDHLFCIVTWFIILKPET